MRVDRLLLTAALATILPLAGCSSTSTSRSPLPAASGGTSTPSLPAVTAPPGTAATLQDAFVHVVKQTAPSVVQIETTAGLGSGIVFDTNGNIVTNAHVVGTATTFKVTFADGRVRTASLVGTFPADDIAVIHVEATGLVAAHFADSTTLQVGDIVVAIGNPLGLSSSVTEGIVSAVNRTVSEGNGNTIANSIQTSAAINPGNSGGALVDLNGDVVGIPTLGQLDPELGGSAPGIGFAIPSNTVVDIATQIIKNGKVTNSHRAWLGVHVTDLVNGGVGISSVTAGGPAQKAGLVAGDAITAINSSKIATVNALSSVLASLQPGVVVTVAVTHQDGSTATVNLTLGEVPSS